MLGGLHVLQTAPGGRQHRMRELRAVVALTVLAIVVAACGDTPATPAPSVSTTPSAVAQESAAPTSSTAPVASPEATAIPAAMLTPQVLADPGLETTLTID